MSRAASSACRTRSTGSARRAAARPPTQQRALDALAAAVDYVEIHNARAYRDANPLAAAFAESTGLPGTASSDAHSVMELGVAQTVVPGPVDGPAALLALLPDATIIKGRASYLVRGWTPVAKVLQRIARQSPYRGRHARIHGRRGAAVTDPDLSAGRSRRPRRRLQPPATCRRAGHARPLVHVPADGASRTCRASPARRSRRPRCTTTRASTSTSSKAPCRSRSGCATRARSCPSCCRSLVLLLLAAALPGFQLDQLPALIRNANPWWLLAAVAIYYVGFPIRGWRWAILIRGVGLPAQGQGLDRDGAHQLAGQLRRAGQAG